MEVEMLMGKDYALLNPGLKSVFLIQFMNGLAIPGPQRGSGRSKEAF